MAALTFLDSNVLLYQLDVNEGRKQELASAIVREAIASSRACISFQVVQEVLNVVTRKAKRLLDEEDATIYLNDVLTPLMRVLPDAALYRRALATQQRWRYSFYDSLIVAAALQAGCKRLLTEDMQHGQVIDGLLVENPFLAA